VFYRNLKEFYFNLFICRCFLGVEGDLAFMAGAKQPNDIIIFLGGFL